MRSHLSLLLWLLIAYVIVGCTAKAPCSTDRRLCAPQSSLSSHHDMTAPRQDRIKGADADAKLLLQNSQPLIEKHEPGKESASRISAPELGLEALIRHALEISPDIQSARERIHIADAFLSESQAAWFPSLALAERYGVTNTPVQAFTFRLNQARLSFDQDFNDPSVVDNFWTQVITEYNLYAGGRQIAATKAAAAEREAAVSGLEGVHNQLIYRVAEAYYRLLQAGKLLTVRRDAVEQVTHHMEMVRKRFRAGTAVKSDVLSVEVRLAEVQEALITARNRLDLAWMVLDNVVGTRVSRGRLPRTVPPAPWSSHVDELHLLMEDALSRRPELERLTREQQAASGRLEAARGARYPTLDFTAQYDFFTGDFTSSNSGFFVGLLAELTLFDGGRTSSRIDQARARMRELNAEHQRLLLDIELDVHRAYVRMREADERLRVAAKAVEHAQESLQEFEVRYRAEVATLTELLDAQVALSDSRARHANARADLEIARTDLERAAGRLAEVLGHDGGTGASGSTSPREAGHW